MTIEKVDLRKAVPAFKAAKKAGFVDVPAMNFIQVDGRGDPNTSKEFAAAIEALYPVAYTLKFMAKNGSFGIDYGVAPLEGLWWAKDMGDFLAGKKENWIWTLMIMQPDFVTEAMYKEAKEKVTAKKDLPAISKIRFAKFAEGKCAQVLYTGPYADEHDTILSLHNFIKQNGYELRGYHHEIYLNDARRTAPEKLKTIIRQPVAKK